MFYQCFGTEPFLIGSSISGSYTWNPAGYRMSKVAGYPERRNRICPDQNNLAGSGSDHGFYKSFIKLVL